MTIPAEVEAAIKRAASQPATVLPSPEQLELEDRTILTVWAQDGTHVEEMLLDTIAKRVRERSDILSYFTTSNGLFWCQIGLATPLCFVVGHGCCSARCNTGLPVHYCTTSPNIYFACQVATEAQAVRTLKRFGWRHRDGGRRALNAQLTKPGDWPPGVAPLGGGAKPLQGQPTRGGRGACATVPPKLPLEAIGSNV